MAFQIKKNDRRPRYRVQLTANGVPVPLTDAVAVRFLMKSGLDGVLKVDGLGSFVNRESGIVEYAWVAGDTDTVGQYNVEFEVDWGNGEIQTFPSQGYFVCTINEDLD